MYNGLQWTKFIVSSQKEDSISTQRVKGKKTEPANDILLLITQVSSVRPGVIVISNCNYL